ncbi:MAG TPA: AmmeMemoRadiSam system protein A [Acidobacteriota bacterium]|jgi:AmmeMemoRadiSam system protein A|nr:AmmeMemoRadiSam system protein A [Acidobacteriota bacterium]HNT16365.1 AmmeMemoRadiSam system protein A [Acidobacteriota bacterium]HPA26513.1 AmmeMemoRadiSam system protein A [Acidobacteriota bacterium]HQO19813.1 AmmeMemoRadiSam system protein A [Acidobacteriota bacterium]HQQ46642.1 AmmeMemoRadiSam system protein A [Acidobacteriota bacterium]
MSLSAEVKSGLLALARKSLETHLREGRRLLKGSDYKPVSEEKRGAFVTLKDENGGLRGCIGMITGYKALDETIIDMAIAAGTQDPRFPKVGPDELPRLRFEISALTPPRPEKEIGNITIGKHGLIMSSGFSKGLLLPQVAMEHDMDRTTFLEHACLKAGLGRNAWKDPGTLIETFEAEVFGETVQE